MDDVKDNLSLRRDVSPSVFLHDVALVLRNASDVKHSDGDEPVNARLEDQCGYIVLLRGC